MDNPKPIKNADTGILLKEWECRFAANRSYKTVVVSFAGAIAGMLTLVYVKVGEPGTRHWYVTLLQSKRRTLTIPVPTRTDTFNRRLCFTGTALQFVCS